MIWYKDSKDDIMVSTRVRLARNVGKYPFPMMLNEKGRDLVKKELVDGVLESNSTLSSWTPSLSRTKRLMAPVTVMVLPAATDSTPVPFMR